MAPGSHHGRVLPGLHLSREGSCLLGREGFDPRRPESVQAARRAEATVRRLTRDVAVPDAIFDPLTEHLDEREIVELTATIAFYNMVARFLVALQIEDEKP